MIAAMDVHLGTPDEVIASLQTDSALARATDLAVQVHSIDPPHPFILRSIELVAEVVAPALGWGRDAARAPASSRDHRAEGTLRMAGTDADVIDALVGITPGSPLDAIRARRPEARAHAQATYRALFAPESPGSVTAPGAFRGGRLRRRSARRRGDRGSSTPRGLVASGASAALPRSGRRRHRGGRGRTAPTAATRRGR